MSYATALQRVHELEGRLGVPSSTTRVQVGSFDKALDSAQNNFANGPQRINTTPSASATHLNQTTVTGRSLQSVDATPAVAPLVVAPQELEASFQASARRNGVPVELLKAVARAESGFNAHAVSHAGAQGLMQLMPATGRGLGVTDPFDPAQSIEGGARYLRNALRTFHGDTRLAVASYNAGTGAVQRFGGVPPFTETRTYVDRVMAYARQYGLTTI